MSRVVVLDTGPLGLLTNPKKTPETTAVVQWGIAMQRAGYRLVVPALADYEVRRELERAGKTKSLAHLDAFNAADPDRFHPVTENALKLAARLWARARNAGTPTADPKELDADVIIAAQALDMNLPDTDYVVATSNVGHLSLFVPADIWMNITP